jgi:hypothetical protein
MKIRLDLDQETAQALIKSGLHELRAPAQQAEVLLRRALGLPFPPEPPPTTAEKESREPAGTARKI